MFHPFIELIRAALEVVEYDFSYQSIFRFLRSGLAERICLRGAFGDEAYDRLTDTDIDMLENYVLAKGIRGRRHWSRPWTFVMRRQESERREGAPAGGTFAVERHQGEYLAELSSAV